MQDYIVAIKWFRKAAEQGIGAACFNLGLMCGFGQSTVQVHVEAYKWFTLAMWKGNVLAEQNRDALADSMKPEQIAEGHRRALQFADDKKIPH